MSTILVVDDDREMGRLLKTLFELEGHQVVVVPRYEEVFSALHRVLPDVVLLDVRLQNKETIELVHKMRQEEGLNDIPVVMTSGMDRRRECLEAGADLFILKPFLPDEVVRMVGGLLKQ
ncbi:MAG TPA: response regulator [Anaerolineales bacterium]|nr:response regulator [Anaerolineae bacterium]HIQ02072.1 response regulator [Anaerolineales bacterium]